MIILDIPDVLNGFIIATAGLKVGISRYDAKIQTDLKLKDEAKTIEYINLPLIETICDEGNADDAITKVANEKKVDFIIIGMKGGGKNFRKIFGGTATSLAKKTNIPLIVVPECAKFKIPRNIVFASDAFIDSDKNVPQDLKAISQLFKSKLNVVKVFNDKEKKSFQASEAKQTNTDLIIYCHS